MTNDPAATAAVAPSTGREATVRRITEAHERLMHLLSAAHSADFIEVGVTMSQAKLLYVVAAAGEMHMAELPPLLGVSLSTVSGLVDRLVDQGLLARREDRADRRQVVVAPTEAGLAAIERFRELNVRQLRELLENVDPDALADVDRGYAVLVEAAASLAGRTGDASHTALQRKEAL
ncbi:MAG: MarR family transcriptional regulator [Chloroflexota bacterium]